MLLSVAAIFTHVTAGYRSTGRIRYGKQLSLLSLVQSLSVRFLRNERLYCSSRHVPGTDLPLSTVSNAQ